MKNRFGMEDVGRLSFVGSCSLFNQLFLSDPEFCAYKQTGQEPHLLLMRAVRYRMEGKMFLSNLTEPQKTAFYNIALGLIYSDDILDINEAHLMAKFKSEMGLSNEKIPKNENTKDLLKAFDTKQSKAILVLELLILAYSDGDFNVDESTYIREIVDTLGINSFDFTEMRWWVEKKTALDREARKFF